MAIAGMLLLFFLQVGGRISKTLEEARGEIPNTQQ